MKRIVKQLAVICVIVFSVLQAIAQEEAIGYDPKKVHTLAQVQEDYKIFRLALEDAHPDLYRYSSKALFDHFFDSVYASLSPMTEEQFFKVISASVANVRCVHTRAAMSEDYVKLYYEKSAKILPLNFKFIEGVAYVSQNHSGDSLFGKATVVKSIDGVEMNKFIQQFIPYISSDGYIQSTSYEMLEMEFKHFYHHFIGEKDSFLLRVVHPVSLEEKEVYVKALSLSEYNKSKKKMDKELLTFILLNEKTAYLKIGTFSKQILRQEKQNFHKFLRRSFDEIASRKIKHLIVDLRNNNGGHDQLGAELYSYLTDSAFTYYRVTDFANATYNPEYLKYAAGPASYTFKIVSNMYKTDSGRYAKKVPLANLHLPYVSKENSYKGKLYVLINGQTLSAGSQVAAYIDTHQRGLLIGQEAGGSYAGPNGCHYLLLQLPNTHLKVNIPLVRTVMNVKEYPLGRGAMPHYEIQSKRRVQGLVTGKDPELGFTLEYIKTVKEF